MRTDEQNFGNTFAVSQVSSAKVCPFELTGVFVNGRRSLLLRFIIFLLAFVPITHAGTIGFARCSISDGGLDVGIAECYARGTNGVASASLTLGSTLVGGTFTTYAGGSPYGTYVSQVDYDVTLTDTIRLFDVASGRIRFDNTGNVQGAGNTVSQSFNGIIGGAGNQGGLVLLRLSSASDHPFEVAVRLQGRVSGYSSCCQGDVGDSLVSYSVLDLAGFDAAGNPAPFRYASAGNYVYPAINGSQIPWDNSYYAPEPASLGLVACGALLLVLVNRRSMRSGRPRAI